MQAREKTIRSVLLPLTKDSVLLPHSAMMEVLPERDIKPLANMPEWVLGEVNWNNKTIPLISLETAFGVRNVEKPKRSRLVIIASLSETNDYKYLAIRTTGVPRLIQLEADVLQRADSRELNDKFIQFYGTLNHQKVIVPDMERLEASLQKQERTPLVSSALI